MTTLEEIKTLVEQLDEQQQRIVLEFVRRLGDREIDTPMNFDEWLKAVQKFQQELVDNHGVDKDFNIAEFINEMREERDDEILEAISRKPREAKPDEIGDAD